MLRFPARTQSPRTLCLINLILMHVLTIIFPLLIAVLASCNSSSNSEWNKALEDSNNSSIDKRKRSVTSEQILGQWKEVAYSFSARDNERLTADLVGGIYFTQDTVYFLEKGDSIVSLSAKFEVHHDSLLV